MFISSTAPACYRHPLAGRSRSLSPLYLCLLATALVWASPSVSAQTGDSSTVAAVSPEGDTEVEVQKLSLADAKALSEKVLNDSGIEDSAKEMLKPKFDQAIADLEEAATLQASAERFRASLETAPKEAETKRQETAKLPNAEEAGTVIGSYESSVELIRELAAAKSNLESLQDEM